MTASNLDRNDPLPLWAQLEADLRRRLQAGEFAERFPTDLELTEGYEVSRHTVREAVRHLNKTGLLRRERGRGTVVDQTEFEQSLGTLYSLFQSVESAGVDQTSEVLALEIVSDADAAVQLEVPADTELVFIERLRMAGGSPLAIDRAWLPLDVAEPLLRVDFSHTALYDELDKIGVLRPDQGWERLTPLVPPAEDRRRLQLEENEAAFFLERLGKQGQHAIEWRTTTIRGDRYRFVAEWSAGSRTSLRPTAR